MFEIKLILRHSIKKTKKVSHKVQQKLDLTMIERPFCDLNRLKELRLVESGNSFRINGWSVKFKLKSSDATKRSVLKSKKKK